MSNALSQAEINQRLIELRNVRKLYENQKERIKVQEKLIKTQRQQITLLKKMNANLEVLLEDFKLQIEELRSMVFGKKKKKSSDDDDLTPPKEKIERTTDSYKRPTPADDQVTETRQHHISECNHCHGILGKKKTTTTVFFEEDIPLPAQKIVRKHVVEKGYCTGCRKWSVSTPLPSSRVILGTIVQKYICYLSVCCRLSYSQIQEILKDTYRMNISEGEIAKVLNREAVRHRPEYEQLKERIRTERGTGLDETGYPVQGENAYAWVMTGMESGESIFLLGESRGGGHTTTLQGEHYRGFSVTDDYGGYKKLKNHQLCWAHLIRKFRDLATSKECGDPPHYKKHYARVAEIFTDLRENRDESLRESYTQRLTDLSVITSHDCLKLVRIKTTLLSNISKYLTCLGNSFIPLTNNQSERSLRHLVLKRKISFGSWTKKGADTLAVLLSVLMSRRQRNPEGYFGEWVGV